MKKNILMWGITLGIVVVLNLLVYSAISLFFPPPEVNEFCPSGESLYLIDSEDKCREAGGEWAPFPSRGQLGQPSESIGPVPSGLCGVPRACEELFEQARLGYEKKAFIIFILFGLTSIILAFYFFAATPAVSLGFSLGGVFIFIVAAIRYWSDAPGVSRLIILCAALAALVFLGVKKNNKITEATDA